MTPGTSPGALANPAVLENAVETETGFGGRTRAWIHAADLWLDLKPGGATTASSQDQRPVRVETAAAEARDHPAAAPGQRLTLAGEPPWTVLAVQRGRPTPGRMTLLLER